MRDLVIGKRGHGYMNIRFSKLAVFGTLFVAASCGEKADVDPCEKPTLTTLNLGATVPPSATRPPKFDGILTSPSNLQPARIYSECNISYILGIGNEGFVQYISTEDTSIIGPHNIRVGQSYHEIKKQTGKEAIYLRGWAHSISLTDEWKAGFYVLANELPSDANVDFFFKGGGYGRRPKE